jgi:TRAP-type transport system periplasmic protein
MMRRVLMIAAATLIATATANAKELIRVGSFTAEKAIGVQEVIIPWMKAVEAEVGDKVELKGFWGGSLGRDPFKQYDLVKSGVVDIAWIVGGYAPGRFPQLHVLELPFMARNAVEAGVAGWEMFSKGLVEGVDDFKVITIWAASGDNLHLRKPIKALEDVKNLRLRTASSAQASTMQTLGAIPQTMGPVQVNDALSRGALDGLVQGYTGMKTFGTFNVVTSTYEIPLGNSPFLLLMNKEKWEALPPEVKAAMDKHGGRALSVKAGQAYDAETQEIRKAQMSDANYTIVTPSPADLDKYRKQLGDIHKDWIAKNKNGEQTYKLFESSLAATRK